MLKCATLKPRDDMPYPTLFQVKALSKGSGNQTGLRLPEFPKITGKMASAFPDDARAFNEAQDELKLAFEALIEKAITEAQ